MRNFDDFIVTTGLVDLKLVNKKFNWYRPDGSSMSRLDRLLMTVEMSNMGKEWVQQRLQRTVIDHGTIILKTTIMDWGLKPFRGLDAKQQHLEFKNVVKEKWKDSLVIGAIRNSRC
ncbi:hypothetical protein SLE2022_314680 [Rubroshorea leprosula]